MFASAFIFSVIPDTLGEPRSAPARLMMSARSMGMTRCRNLRVSSSSLKMQVSNRSGRGPTSPTFAPMNPRETAQTRTKSATAARNVGSSGNTIPPKRNGIFRRCSPEDIDNVPQNESDLRLPSSVKAPSFVPKRNTGLCRNAAATVSAETSSPNVIVPMMTPSMPCSRNRSMTLSASPSSRTQPLRVRLSSGTMISTFSTPPNASRQRRRISSAQFSSNGSRWAGTNPSFTGSI